MSYPAEECEMNGTVIDRGDDPRLCVGVLFESLPPRCAHSIPVDGLNWGDVPTRTYKAGVTWAELRLTGTYDGERLTLTRRPEPAEGPADSGRCSDDVALA